MKTPSKLKKLAKPLLAAALAAGLAGSALAADAANYDDVPDWAKEYVETVTQRGLVDGKTETAFGAGDDMTRADLVAALYRLAGSPAADAANPFEDVAENAPYRNAVVWASQNGIVNGKSARSFDPDGSVRRQEIAKIFNEFAALQAGKEELKSRKDEMSAYPDAAEVDGWAKDYMNWAVACELINGSDGKLLPKGSATRAQVSAILCRYMDDASTGDASQDDPRNQDGIGKKELLVVSFGASYNDSRVAAIKAVEDAMAKAFPDYSVRRGFTANIIIEHVYRRDGVAIDDVDEALDRAKKNGVEELLVQPTHLMNGWEYGDLVKALEKRAGDFQTIKIGAPLLTSDDDFAKVADAMVKATEDLVKDDKTAVCYMGHGTAAASNAIYAKMQKTLEAQGHKNYFIGTVEAAPTAEDLVKLVKEGGYETVILRPMMIVAGDHANNDMASDEEDSWKSVFSAAGLKVQCEIKGLGELEAVQNLLTAHAKDAKPLGETGIEAEPNPNAEAGEPKGLADGVYTIQVECEQSMFKIDSCTLTVKDGEMTAELVLGSESFDKMFAGTESAAKLAQQGVVEGVKDGAGKTAFTLPVAQLDKALDYAAHSVNRDRWYDRTLTFQADTVQAK